MIDGNPDITFLNDEYKAGRLTKAEYEKAVAWRLHNAEYEQDWDVLHGPEQIRSQKEAKKR